MIEKLYNTALSLTYSSNISVWLVLQFFIPMVGSIGIITDVADRYHVYYRSNIDHYIR